MGILGVELSFNLFVNNTLHTRVSNTAQRREDLDATVAWMLRLQHAYEHSRCPFLRALELRAAGIKRAMALFDEVVFALEAAINMLNAPPRIIRVDALAMPCWVFTDASAEDSVDVPGDPAPKCHVSHKVPSELVSAWPLDAPVQVIAQAETFAVVVAKA
eukprot:4362614-Amphidinium_carterae.1